MSNWKMSPSRTALGVAVTAAALATSIGAHAAPIQPENDDALFKLRYSANGPASAAAREAINRAILPLIDASATDEYTLEPVANLILGIAIKLGDRFASFEQTDLKNVRSPKLCLQSISNPRFGDHQ